VRTANRQGGRPGWAYVRSGTGRERQDKNVVIAGRTSALAIANLDEAVKRAKAYEAAGVEAIFLAGGVTVEAVDVVSSAIKIPLILELPVRSCGG
jgi:carboxyvinyl-carboxyphosphonate phosphorylmutase